MLLKSWNDMPIFIKNDDVKRYYDVLARKKYSLIAKRAFDIVMSLFMIILVSPLLILLAVWIKLDSRGPVFYRQERITQYGKVFRIFKFRTMVIDADKQGPLITTSRDSRITKVGNKIRRIRFDEIPQLFNIFVGDMSFVGTRPEVKKYVDLYTDEMKATLLLPAGVTSLASIKYDDEGAMYTQHNKKSMSIDEFYSDVILPEKMKFNLMYLFELSLLTDINICVKTIFRR